VNPFLKVAQTIGRQPWLPKAGPYYARLDTAVQRVTGGRFSPMRLAGLTSVLLTTTGRRSGLPRSVSLLTVPDGGSLILIGSNFGKSGHPAWSANLKTNPEATVHLRGHAFPVTATLLAGDDRAAAWATATKTWPAFDVYAARAGREIRVFRVNLR
jgi:deazaflavin-dependent oxidoreductase (nitroreductase family)